MSTATLTPTRLPGLRAAIARRAAALLHAAGRVPVWHSVSVAMLAAAVALAAFGPDTFPV
jgi:hypothetical protein